MKNQAEEVLDKVTDFLKNEVKTETVVGKPFTLGEFECVPVISFGMGFGYGGGEGEAPKEGHGEGSGAGAGMGVTPIGFLVSRQDHISFIATKGQSGLASAMKKVPGLVDKFMAARKEN
jgi:uncharacterized spore protein YtfJ